MRQCARAKACRCLFDHCAGFGRFGFGFGRGCCCWSLRKMGKVFTGLVASCLVVGGCSGLTLTQRVFGSRERSKQERGEDGLLGRLETGLERVWPEARVG